ncbi:MAG: sugar transferase [Bacteroidota bacterium]
MVIKTLETIKEQKEKFSEDENAVLTAEIHPKEQVAPVLKDYRLKYVSWFFIVTDLFIILAAYFLTLTQKESATSYLKNNYLIALAFFIFIWYTVSIFTRKFAFKKTDTLRNLLMPVLYSNLIVFATISVIMFFFQNLNYSRMIVTGTILLATLFEIIFVNLYYLMKESTEEKEDIHTKLDKFTQSAIIDRFLRSNLKQDVIDNDLYQELINRNLKFAIINDSGLEVYNFIKDHVNLTDTKTLVLETTTRFNIEMQPVDYFTSIVNLKRINDIQRINKFFESVNRKLPDRGIFIGCVETKFLRKQRILNKYPPVLNWLFYFFDFILKRVFPKFKLTRGLYFLLTRGQNRVLTRAETLGRLYSCGFEVINEQFIGACYYFVCKKVKQPAYDMNASYGPLVRLRRIGKNGKIIKVYKMRTMHPYAEYLQDYVYNKFNLAKGGKFNNDFRISTAGKIMRKLWLDELPMLLNVIKGEMKIVGVRPLSLHYYNLYPEELKQKRIKYKPGLIPPYYADLPKTLEEIIESEMKYLEAYEKCRILTDLKYFHKALYNIIIKKARSS